jgi:DMSO/TMAO reductase YedYZ molybdopterin-dependent catalytic subunit
MPRNVPAVALFYGLRWHNGTKEAPVPHPDLDKTQTGEAPSADAQPPEAIVSPDTRRAERVPPGQTRTAKWPVLDASGPPTIDMQDWRLRLGGLVAQPVEWTWDEFGKLPRVKVFGDFHCVTRWSRLGNLWEGVATRELIARAGGVRPKARFVVAYGYDRGWTTNLPLEHFLAEDALVTTLHDGKPISPEHGGPARLIVPRLYAWKSAKWIHRIELVEQDRPGFWEANGYHMRGDPWTEERFGV